MQNHKGKVQEVEAAYHKYRDMLFRIAFVYMKNIYDTEDAIHDCFIRLFQHKGTFAGEENRKAWLIVVISNICKDKLRKSHRKDSSYEEMKDYLPGHDHLPQVDEMLGRIMRLPERLITPVYMYYYEGYSTAEISKVLGRKDSTVRNQLREARLLLKIEIEKEELVDSEAGHGEESGKAIRKSKLRRSSKDTSHALQARRRDRPL